MIKRSLKDTIADAIISQPKDTFVTEDIIKDVTDIMPDVNIGSLRTCFRRDLQNKIFWNSNKRFGKKTVWTKIKPESFIDVHKQTKVPEPEQTVSSFAIGESIIDYINELKKKITVLGVALSDLKTDSKKSDEDWRQIVKEKDKTIERLNRSISIMNTQQGRTFNLGETARFIKR